MNREQVLEGVNFDVGMVPVQYSVDGSMKTSEGDFVTYRKDSGKALGVVGSRYVVEDHKENILMVADMLKEFGDYDLSHKMEHGRIFSKFSLNSQSFLSDEEKAKPMITCLNSYDGSKPFGLTFGFFRFVCSNGVYFGETLHKVSKLHTQSLQDSGVKDKILHSIKEELTYQTGLYEKTFLALSKEKLIPIDVLESKLPERLVKTAMEESYPEELALTHKENAWTQFQAFTRTITHKDNTETTKGMLHKQVIQLFQNVYAIR